MTRGLRWLVGIGVLVTVVTGCGTGVPVAGGSQGSSSAPAAAAVSSDTTTTTTAPTTTSTTAAPSTTTTAPKTTTTTAPKTTTTAPPAPPPPAATPPTPAPSAGPSEWVVKPGESFWSIAAAIADTRAGGQATAKAVDGVWRALIDANAGLLPQPRNPSLLYVGTTLTVPP